MNEDDFERYRARDRERLRRVGVAIRRAVDDLARHRDLLDRVNDAMKEATLHLGKPDEEEMRLGDVTFAGKGYAGPPPS